MRVVITAGPTREPIDPVRFISNRSSGKMGYALAEASIAGGHEVTLISGPVSIAAPAGARVVSVTTSDELYDAVHRAVAACDVLVMCAAVSDYKPVAVAKQKMPKQSGAFSLQLTATRDILASVAREPHSFVVVGFAAETHELESKARAKLRAKNCDIIVANNVSRSDSGMESDDNEVIIFLRDGALKTISRAPKKIIAHEIMKIVFEFAQKSLTKIL